MEDKNNVIGQCDHTQTFAIITFWKIQRNRISRKSGFSMHFVNNVSWYKRECRRNPNFNTMECDRRQHDCLISLCYCPAVFFGHLLVRFFGREEEVGARYKNVISYFLLLEELRVWNFVTWNCVIHGLPVLCYFYCVQFIAELVFRPFIAGLKTKTEGMEYLLFQASIPLIWPRFHLIFITSIIAVEVLSCLVSWICRRWTVVTRWWGFRCLEFSPLPTLQFLFLWRDGHSSSVQHTRSIKSFTN